jgi:hypothetical protein
MLIRSYCIFAARLLRVERVVATGPRRVQQARAERAAAVCVVVVAG